LPSSKPQNEEKGESPRAIGWKGGSWGPGVPLVCFQAAEHSWKSGRENEDSVSQHFNTLFHRTRPHGRAKSNSRWQVKSAHSTVVWFFFPFKGKLFLHNEFLRIFHLYELAAGKSGLGVSQPRKSIRCGCCSGNETFHDQSGKRQKGKSTIFQCFFPARFGEFATMQMEGK